jgi:acyl-ACP thioesterase
MSDRRLVTVTRQIGLADVRPDGRARLDAIARIVQDAADHDAATAPDTDDMGVWILRRLAIDLAHTPRLRAQVTATTYCTGVGARWAERTTELRVGEQSCVTTTALWVHVDRERGTPIPLPKSFDAVWGATAQGRKVSARLQHGAPTPGIERQHWPLRATDLDVLDHVNNAAYWAPVEEELARRGRPQLRRAEIEFRSGLLASDDVDVLTASRTDGFACWLVVGDDVRASMLVGCAS